MPSSRKLLGAAAFSLALAGGGAAGALLGTPGTSGAQDTTSSTATATAPDGTTAPDGARPHGGPGFGGPGERLDAAAEVIGITADELKTELEAGKSIAQVAEAHDVDPQDVIDALVAKGMERLKEMEANLPDRVTEAVNREGLPQRPEGHRGPRPDGAPDQATTTTTATS
jgi:hypothetical protein